MSAQVTGLILAGGLGSRMGTVNKGLVDLAGKPMIKHVIDKLAPQVDDIIISANDDINQYQSFGYPVVKDEFDQLGPLAGILSALSAISSDHIFITACDMPLLPIDIVAALIQPPFSSTELARAPLIKGKIEPLACLVRGNAIANIAAQLDTGQRSVLRWLESCRVTPVELPDDTQAAFLNINTRHDLTRAEDKNAI